MARFRMKKQELERLLTPPAWPETIQSVPQAAFQAATDDSVSALIALLPRGGLMMWRAAVMAGYVVARTARCRPEEARVIMRRLIWHLNEDSGNMGWGVPQAFGEILAQSPELAAEYGRIALSYVRDTGFADNYIEHGPLRRGAYWAIGRFAPLHPAYRDEGKELLAQGLEDEDAACRGIAAWGLGEFAKKGLVHEKEIPALAGLLEKERENTEECDVFEAMRRYLEPASFFVWQTAHRLGLSFSG